MFNLNTISTSSSIAKQVRYYSEPNTESVEWKKTKSQILHIIANKQIKKTHT